LKLSRFYAHFIVDAYYIGPELKQEAPLLRRAQRVRRDG